MRRARPGTARGADRLSGAAPARAAAAALALLLAAALPAARAQEPGNAETKEPPLVELSYLGVLVEPSEGEERRAPRLAERAPRPGERALARVEGLGEGGDGGGAAPPASALRLERRGGTARGEPGDLLALRFVADDERADGGPTIEFLAAALGATRLAPQTLVDEQGRPRARTEEMRLAVLPALEEAESEPAPRRPARRVALDAAGLLLVVGALVLFLALLGYVVGRLIRQPLPQAEEPPLPPPRPADERALEALDALVASELLARGELKAFAVRLAEIGKGFLGEVHGAPLLERTSSECRDALRAAGAPVARAAWLEEWLAGLDMIKFAGARPAAASLEDAAAELRHVVEEVGAEERERARVIAAEAAAARGEAPPGAGGVEVVGGGRAEGVGR